MYEVINKAIELGACSNSLHADNERKLAHLFFSPQGVEFCLGNNFPPLETFRDFEFAEKYGVYVDKQDIYVSNRDVALINSNAVLSFSGTERSYKVILMHGAKADIHLENYAVVRIEGDGAKVTNDGTGVILS